ncbi:methyl-accepting chemotaxis protein [Motilibacter peucedani]|uniref:Methyl-accepting chemotaxis protein n=2 Tax=Motilibacter peucedani TaxID=598650 RepID=A0A420XRW6_9ACTN|nr:methyl-accepting chemotaxis protein [Motilibacter peucedani]
MTLSDEVFGARHRVLMVVLLAQVPVLAVIGLASSSGGVMLWAQLPVVLLLAACAQWTSSQAGRAATLSLGLMVCADVLVHVTGGLTDAHLWFYVMLVLVSLYQMWTPFVLAILFVAVHHLSMSLADPASVFSDPRAQRHPVGFALLHAFFLLAEGVGLAYGWRFAEAAEAERAAQAAAAAQERHERDGELAAERARAAEEAAERLAAREARSGELARRLDVLDGAGARLSEDVASASAVMHELRVAGQQIASTADAAARHAQQADERSDGSAATIARLSSTMAQIEQTATSIATIAEQTNMLALNATIEAARAGESGRGFAVVADEVKQLAQATSRATEQIRQVVDTVRADVDEAGRAIGGIREVIRDVVAFQETIAAAVEQQSAATESASAAISSASTEAARVAEDLRGVALAAE